MKIKITLLFAIFCCSILFAQVGINTTTPSSTLNGIGSQEGTYTDVVASAILDNTHFFVSFTGSTAAQILTLPASVAFPNDFGGRFYYIKNNGTVDITIKGNGTENLRYGGIIASTNTYVLKAGYYLLIVKNNNTSGDTWDVAVVGAMPENPTTGRVIKKVIYDGIAGAVAGNNYSDASRTVKIGELEFSFNGAQYTAVSVPPYVNGWAATPQVRFFNPIAANKSLYVGVNQQWSPSGFEYTNVKLDFTTANSSTYQYLTPTAWNGTVWVASPLTIGELNIFNIIDVVNDKYYKVTFYVSGQSGASSYAIIAEYY